MNKLISNIPTVGIFGATNAGKSALFNLLLNKELAIVSSIKNTTTDPISSLFELVGYGKLRLIDTAGYLDNSLLSKLRTTKTNNEIEKVNLGLYLINAGALNIKDELSKYQEFINFNKELKTLLLINKTDLLTKKNKKLITSFSNAIFLESDEKNKQTQVYNLIKNNLEKNIITNLLAGINLPNKAILLVIPLDSEAPLDRLILPQSRLISDAIKLGINVQVVSNTKLEEFFKTNKNPLDLVVTDSKIFKEVDLIVPKNIYLTSFSILLAREKGNLETFYNDLLIINKLNNNKTNKILIKEACTHSKNHEDIGTVIIPKLLKKLLGENTIIEFSNDNNFELIKNNYDLVIHCGACMLSNTQMKNRINYIKTNELKITNYGLFLAYASGILERAIEIFK